MRLSRLFLYPVKSMAGVEVQSAAVDDFGIAHDRRWLVVDPDGIALTQREHARLALIQPSLAGGSLQLAAPSRSTLLVDSADGGRRQVTVWDDTVTGEDAGDQPAEWLSDFLDRAVRLVYMSADSFRPVDPQYSPAHRRVSFADAFPFLLISQESMDELNRRLDQPIGIERFRPNLVIAGAPEPHIEDEWRTIRIGALQFDLVKPCERCAVPTIDPRTAQRGKEPTRTLATYRRRNGKVYFGQNAIHRTPGTLHVNDMITVEPLPGLSQP
jgi:MOSC domain-containing protein